MELQHPTKNKYCYIRVAMGKKPAQSLCFFFLISLSLLFPQSDAGSLVVYWGQNEGEGYLTKTCKTGLFGIVNIAFLSTFGNGSQPQINLAGHCSPASNGCKGVATGIRSCQRRGVKVMLSIGGSTNTYSLSSQDDARHVADYIWNHFLGGKSKSRPFGNAILDGVDFEIEGGELHYAALAYRLHDHYATSNRKFYLTAAPQCPFQDNLLYGALSTGLFDHVWIQFYNNPQCEFSSNDPSGFKSAWSQWTTSINATKFFVGLPASLAAARTGFVPLDALINQLLPIVRSPKYGGVMLWDRFHDLQSGYSRKIRRRV